MKYRHYAPKAELTIVSGTQKNAAERIAALVHEQIKAGRKAGIICSDETKEMYPEGTVWSLGARTEETQIAAHLYGILRACDTAGVDVIYSEAFRTPQLGDAIMNRLTKAAGHRIIDADEKDEQI